MRGVVQRVAWFLVVGVAFGVTGCSDGGGGDDATEAAGGGAPADSGSAPAPALAALESAGTAGFDELLVGREGELALAIAVGEDGAVAYLCDGYTGEWFTGEGEADLRSAAGSVLTVAGDEATVTAEDGATLTLVVATADGDDDLVRFAEDEAVGGLVMVDGLVRGSVTRGTTGGVRPSPTTSPTTTTVAATDLGQRFVRDVTVELGDVGRSTLRLDLRCAEAVRAIEDLFAAMEANIESMHAGLVAQARTSIEDLRAPIPDLEQQAAAIEPQLAAIDAEYQALIQRLQGASDPAEVRELQHQTDDLLQQRNALDAQRRSLLAERDARVQQVGELEAQIVALEAQSDEAVAALAPQRAAAVALAQEACPLD